VIFVIFDTRYIYNIPEEEEEEDANINCSTFKDLKRRSVA